MNNQLKNFIRDIGVLTEMWTVIYQGFIDQGYSKADALVHTREFNAAILIATMNNTNKNKEETND